MLIIGAIFCHLWCKYAEEQVPEWTTSCNGITILLQSKHSPQLSPAIGYVKNKQTAYFRRRISYALDILFLPVDIFYIDEWEAAIVLRNYCLKSYFWQLNTLPNIDYLEGIQWVHKMVFTLLSCKKFKKWWSQFQI